MSESTSETTNPLGKSSAIVAAKLCFWSPFAACLAFASIASFVLFAGIHSLFAMWITFAVSGLLLVGGFVAGCVALARMGLQGADGVLGRAVTGICLNLGLICLLCVADPRARGERVRERGTSSPRPSPPQACGGEGDMQLGQKVRRAQAPNAAVPGSKKDRKARSPAPWSGRQNDCGPRVFRSARGASLGCFQQPSS